MRKTWARIYVRSFRDEVNSMCELSTAVKFLAFSLRSTLPFHSLLICKLRKVLSIESDKKKKKKINENLNLSCFPLSQLHG